MFDYLLETVVVAFCFGGVLGALGAMQFLGRKGFASEEEERELVKIRIPRE